MSVWLLHMPLSRQEEEQVSQRELLPLPFGDAPDLRATSGLHALKQALATMHPDAPPETIHRRAAPVWEQYEALQREDVVAVPLPHRKQAAVAEVIDPYVYQPDAVAPMRHAMRVQWAQKYTSWRAFERDAPMLRLEEVKDQKQRVRLRACLPYRYNRFARWRWILAVFMGLSLLTMLSGLLRELLALMH